MRRSSACGWGLGVAAAVVLGCGSSEPPAAPTGARMVDEVPAAEEAPTATDENRPPRMEWVELRPARPRAGEPVRAVARASDPEGDPVRFRYHWRVNGRPVAGAGEELSLRNVRRGDRIAVEVTASDGRAESDPMRREARIGNRAPHVSRVWLEPRGEVHAGMKLTAVAEAADPDGDPLAFEYQWTVNGRAVDSSGNVFETDSLRRGDRIQVRALASDGSDTSEPGESALFTLTNAPPRIVSKPAGVDAGGVFRYRVSAEDPDGDRPLRFHLVRAPEGMEIDPLGEVSWQPTAEQEGRHPVEIVVEDPHGARIAQRFELIIGGGDEAAPAAPQP